MIFKRIIFLLAVFFSVHRAKASQLVYFTDAKGMVVDSIKAEDESLNWTSSDKRPNPILQLIKLQRKKNKKITAAILAFPFPFGIVGLHRIYLGTAPYVPIAYIGSVGGVFGILPFIDFCVIVLDKDIERYNNNSKIFMWVN